jgi:hypothetical protein
LIRTCWTLPNPCSRRRYSASALRAPSMDATTSMARRATRSRPELLGERFERQLREVGRIQGIRLEATAEIRPSRSSARTALTGSGNAKTDMWKPSLALMRRRQSKPFLTP